MGSLKEWIPNESSRRFIKRSFGKFVLGFEE